LQDAVHSDSLNAGLGAQGSVTVPDAQPPRISIIAAIDRFIA
jgi:hypothetical protein